MPFFIIPCAIEQRVVLVKARQRSNPNMLKSKLIRDRLESTIFSQEHIVMPRQDPRSVLCTVLIRHMKMYDAVPGGEDQPSASRHSSVITGTSRRLPVLGANCTRLQIVIVDCGFLQAGLYGGMFVMTPLYQILG